MYILAQILHSCIYVPFELFKRCNAHNRVHFCVLKWFNYSISICRHYTKYTPHEIATCDCCVSLLVVNRLCPHMLAQLPVDKIHNRMSSIFQWRARISILLQQRHNKQLSFILQTDSTVLCEDRLNSFTVKSD